MVLFLMTISVWDCIGMPPAEIRSGAILTNTDTVRTSAYRDSARVALKAGDYRKSGYYYAQAARLFFEGGNFKTYIDMLRFEADSYRRAGDFSLAEQIAQRSIEACESYLEGPQLQSANAYHLMGIIKDYQGLQDEAIQFNEKALSIHLQLSGKPKQALGDVYNSLGVNYLNRGDYKRSLDRFFEALTIFQEILEADDQRIADMYLNIGTVYIDLGKYQLAQEYMEQELAITTKNMGQDHPYVAETCTNLGSIHAQLGNVELAKSYFERSLDIASRHFGDNSPYTIDAHHNLAVLYSDMGNNQKAIDYFTSARKVIAHNFGNEHVEMGKIYYDISQHHLKLHQLETAEDYARQSLGIFRNILGDKNLLVARSYLVLAECAKQQGDQEQALVLCQQGLVALVNDFSSDQVNQNPTSIDSFNPGTYLSLLDLKSDLFYQRYLENDNVGQLELVMSTLRLADQLTDAIQREQVPFEDKLNLAEQTDFVYEKLVKTSYQLYSVEGDDQYLLTALYYADKSKASILKQAIAEDAAQNFGDIPDSLLQVERNLKADRNYFRTRIATEQSKKQPDSSALRKYQGNLFVANRTYDSLILSLESQYPRYFQLKHHEPELDLDQFQAMLSGQTVVEYFYSDDLLYTFVLNDTGYDARSTPISENFQELIISLREQLSSSGSQNEFIATSETLYKLLISPVENHFREGDRLTIVPHGLLAVIPFDVLIKPPREPTFNILEADYLLNRHPVTYAFSISSMEDYQGQSKQWQSHFAGFAPSYKQALLVRSEELEPYGNLRNELAELAYTEDEVKAAATYFSQAETFSGEKATETNFKSISGNFQVLHLAMHAIVDQQNPLHSKLIFSQTQSSSPDDGYLQAREIYDLNLNADLAVLSACNTAYGKLIGGEGIMSLGRAFAYAGCPSIVMSLWPAQDQATARLMSLFYEGLSSGLSKDQALRKAKMEYLATTDDLFAHPFYWANFIVQGDPEPLQQPANRNLIWVFSVLIILLFGLYIILKK